MVAPRMRAERPAEIVPAARPARKGSRRVAAEATVDRSPPAKKPSGRNGTATSSSKANGASTAKATGANGTAAKAAKQASQGNGAAGAAVATKSKEAARRKKSEPELQGEQLIKA